jgi:hypothetical protein
VKECKKKKNFDMGHSMCVFVWIANFSVYFNADFILFHVLFAKAAVT